MDNEESREQMGNDLIQEVCALITDQFDGAVESREHLFPKKLGRCSCIILTCSTSFSPLGEIICGYNDVPGLRVLSCRAYGSYKVYAPLLKRLSSNHWRQLHLILPYWDFSALALVTVFYEPCCIAEECWPP